jgi:hypothetical protein
MAPFCSPFLSARAAAFVVIFCRLEGGSEGENRDRGVSSTSSEKQPLYGDPDKGARGGLASACRGTYRRRSCCCPHLLCYGRRGPRQRPLAVALLRDFHGVGSALRSRATAHCPMHTACALETLRW